MEEIKRNPLQERLRNPNTVMQKQKESGSMNTEMGCCIRWNEEER